MGVFDIFKKKSQHDILHKQINRKDIPSDIINHMQQQSASCEYIKLLKDKYFKDYPEIPFISKDRELNTNWLEQSVLFPEKIIKPDKMTRFCISIILVE